MTKLELMVLAAEAYGNDGVMCFYFDPETGEPTHNDDAGDPLARFIVEELHETFDPNASREAQLEEALRVMERANHDVGCVVVALARASGG